LAHLDRRYPKLSEEVQVELRTTCEEIYKKAQALVMPYAEKYAMSQGFKDEPQDPEGVEVEG
jgi:hypothetical protein